VLKNRKRSGCY